MTGPDPRREGPQGPVSRSDAARRALPAHFRTKSWETDTAGTPWAGRGHAPSPFPGDDGSVPAQLVAALAAGERGEDPHCRALVAALAGTRVLVPIMAVAAGRSTGHAGVQADNGADMAMVSLRAPDGAATLPIFSSVAALAAWRTDARPVPVIAEQAAQAAVQEGCTALLLDPEVAGGGITLSRSALWALAQGRAWIPPHEDTVVREELALIARDVDGVVSIIPGPGRTREVDLHVRLVPGLDAAGVRTVVGALSQELSRSSVVAERITSVRLALASA